MRTNGHPYHRQPRRRPAAKPRFVAVGDKEHYDTGSAQDYREYLAVQRLSSR